MHYAYLIDFHGALPSIGTMNYVLDTHRLRELIAARGYESLNDFASKEHVHRNTLYGYISEDKSVLSSVLNRIAQSLEVDPLHLIRRSDMGGSESDEYKALLQLIRDLCKMEENLAFVLLGSRAKRRSRIYSDWDLGLTGGRQKIGTRTYLAVKSSIQDATEDFSRTVDVVNLDVSPSWFIEGINYTPEFLGGRVEAFQYLLGFIHGIRRKNLRSAG